MLERDLKTATSAEATRAALRAAHSSPFEARGQVFVVAEADTLSAEAGDALLKLLEEPGLGAPRHFLLLAPSRLDLPATLRSRSLAIYLGAPIAESPEKLAALADAFGDAVASFAARRGPLDLLRAAATLATAGDFEDPRAQRPWLVAAAAVRDAATAAASPGPPPPPRGAGRGPADRGALAPPARHPRRAADRGAGQPPADVERLTRGVTSSAAATGGSRPGSAARGRGSRAGW